MLGKLAPVIAASAAAVPSVVTFLQAPQRFEVYFISALAFCGYMGYGVIRKLMRKVESLQNSVVNIYIDLAQCHLERGMSLGGELVFNSEDRIYEYRRKESVFPGSPVSGSEGGHRTFGGGGNRKAPDAGAG